MTSTKRITLIDVLKGASMIGIVLAHIALLQNNDGLPEEASTVENIISYLVSVPYSLLCTFFIISGYFYKPGRGFIANVKDRVLKIFITFTLSVVVFNTLMYIYLSLTGYDLELSSLWEVIWRSFFGKWAFMDLYDPTLHGERIMAVFEVTHPLYFLQILMVGYIIFYAIADHVLDDWRKVVVAAVLLFSASALYLEFVAIYLPFNAQLGPMVAAFLLIGAFMGRHGFYEWMQFGKKDRKYWGVFIACGTISIVTALLFHSGVELIYSHFGEYTGIGLYPFVVTALSGGIFMSFLLCWVSKIHIIRDGLVIIGTYCLIVHVSHMFLARLLVSPFVTFDTVVWIPVGLVWGIIVSFAVIIIAIAITKLLERYLKKRSQEETA